MVNPSKNCLKQFSVQFPKKFATPHRTPHLLFRVHPGPCSWLSKFCALMHSPKSSGLFTSPRCSIEKVGVVFAISPVVLSSGLEGLFILSYNASRTSSIKFPPSLLCAYDSYTVRRHPHLASTPGFPAALCGHPRKPASLRLFIMPWFSITSFPPFATPPMSSPLNQ